MRSTFRLLKPILLTFEHAGQSRAEVVTNVTFSSHWGEIPGPDGALVRQVCAALDGLDETDQFDLDTMASLDLAGGIRDAYVDAGFRAGAFINAQLAEAAGGADVPTLDMSHLASRGIGLAEFMP